MMKRKIQLLCLFVCMAFGSFAQMKEGVLTYDMTFTTDNPDMAMYIGMMQGSKMTMSFMPGKTRSEVTMGVMSTVTTQSMQSMRIWMKNRRVVNPATKSRTQAKRKMSWDTNATRSL
jgi:hypothetical protein